MNGALTLNSTSRSFYLHAIYLFLCTLPPWHAASSLFGLRWLRLVVKWSSQNFWHCQDFIAGNLLVPNSDEAAFLEPVSRVLFWSQEQRYRHVSLARVIFHLRQYVAGLKRKVVKVAGLNNKKCGMKCVFTTWPRRFHPGLPPFVFSRE